MIPKTIITIRKSATLLVYTMTRLSEEEKKYLIYQIYSHRYDDPWIANKKVAKLVNHSISTVNRYARDAEESLIILNPHLRLKPYSRKAALLQFEDKWSAFNQLRECAGIEYLTVYQGTWDIIAVCSTDIDFTQIPGYKRKILEGVQGEIFTPKVRYTTWEKSFTAMENLLRQETIQKSRIECNPCSPEWSTEDWCMYHYFKSDVRKKFSYLRKKHLISWRMYGEWKKSVRDYCAILVSYFPEGYHAYDQVSLCIKTDCEHFVVNVFSQLPTTPNFYKIGDYLFATVYVSKDYRFSMKMYDIISTMQNQRVITQYMDGKGIVMLHDEVVT